MRNGHFAYPEIAHLRPNSVKIIVLLLISVLFTVTGIVMIRSGNVTGWLCAIFFGACLAVGLISLMPGASELVVLNEGFAIRSLFRTRYYAWSEVSDFGVFAVSTGHTQKKMIGFRGPVGARKAAQLSALISGGYTHSLPDSYGFKPEALADNLNAYRNVALKAEIPSQSL